MRPQGPNRHVYLLPVRRVALVPGERHQRGAPVRQQRHVYRAFDGRRRIRPAPQIKNVILPLDGSKLGEQVLPHAKQLIKALGLNAHLVRVTPPGGDTFRPTPSMAPPRSTMDPSKNFPNQWMPKLWNTCTGSATVYMARVLPHRKSSCFTEIPLPPSLTWPTKHLTVLLP